VDAGGLQKIYMGDFEEEKVRDAKGKQNTN